MDRIKKHVAILLTITALGGFLFYWFQWRPVVIRSNCHKWVVDLPGEVEGLRSDGQIRAYEALFNRCLHEKGLR